MPIIPEYTFAEGQHAPSTASPDMAALPNLANAKYIGPAIRDGGEAVMAITESLLKSEGARATTEVRNAWGEQEDELHSLLATEKDGTRRRSLVETYLAKGWDAFKGAMVPSEAQAGLEEEGKQREQRVKQEAETGSLRISREQGAEAVRKGLQRARERKDAAGAEQTIDVAVNGGFVAADAKPKLMQDFHRDVDEAKVRELIKDHPLDAAGWIASPEFAKNFRGLPPERQGGLLQEAIAARGAFRAEAFSKITNNALQGIVLSRDELETMRKDSVLTDQDAAAYAVRWHGPPPASFHAPTYNQLVSDITFYRPALDASGVGEAQIRERIGSARLPDPYLKELQERLDGKTNPQAKAEAKPHEMAAHFEQKTQERFDSGAFGNRFWQFQVASYHPAPITGEEWAKSHERRQHFTQTWEAYLRHAPANATLPEVEKVYEEFYRQMVTEPDVEPLIIPGQDPAAVVDAKSDRAMRLPVPQEGTAPGQGAAAPTGPPAAMARYGRLPVLAPGRFYRGGRAIGAEGDAPGAAVPREVLEASFPGKDEAWFLQNVKVMVEAPDGRRALLPLSSTSGRGGGGKRPVLDMTAAAVRDLGGSMVALPGGGSRVEGIGEISFALTTDNAGVQADLANQSLEEVTELWFEDKKPVSPEQIVSGLRALQARWLEAQRQRDEAVVAEDDQGVPRAATQDPGF
jgi:hypothetical protein